MGKKISSEIIGPFLYKQAETEEEIHLARKLHHDGYLEVGYIERSTATGTIEDGYHKFSDYLIAIYINDNQNGSVKGKVVGVIRAVRYSSLDFPVMNEFKFYKKWEKFLREVNLNQVIEVGALFTKPGYYVARGLYRQVWQFSKLNNYKYWLAAIDERLFKVFTKRFCFYFDQIGKKKFYLGSVSVPALLECQKQKKLMYQHAPEFAAFYDKFKFPYEIERIIELV